MTNPDPTASLDAEQARQRVLDLLGSAGRTTKAGYYADVQDVCRIALEAMDERDDLREQLNISEIWKRAAAQQPAADDSLRKAAQAFVDEPYQTDSARFHGLRNDLRAALAAAPAPRQDDALRDLREWMRPWPARMAAKECGPKTFYDALAAKIDELLAAKPPAPAEPPAAPADDERPIPDLGAWVRHIDDPACGALMKCSAVEKWRDRVIAELCRDVLARRNQP